MALTMPTLSYSVYCNPKAKTAITTGTAYNADDPGYFESYRRLRVLKAGHAQEVQSWGGSAGIENTQGVYSFSRWTRLMADIPVTMPVVAIFEVVTPAGAKSVPSALSATAWDSTSISDAFIAMLTAFKAQVDPTGRVAVIAVGNESDTYFDAHSGEIAAFVTFLTRVRTAARSLWGTQVLVGSVFTRSASADYATTYAGVAAIVDWHLWTYYLTNADYTVKSPTDVGTAFSDINTACGGGKFFFTETNCPTDVATLGGSETAQLNHLAQISSVGAVYSGLNLFMGATIAWMSELSSAILTDDGLTGNQRAFYGSLGLRNTNDSPKSAYEFAISMCGGWSDTLGTGDVTTAFANFLRGVPLGEDMTSMLRWRLASKAGYADTSDVTTVVSKFLSRQI